MTEIEGVAILKACKPLAERLISQPSSPNPTEITLSDNDLRVMENYASLLLDPIVAGPNLLNKLVKLAGLSQVEIYKLDQVKQMIKSRRYGGLKASTHFRLGAS